MNTLVSDRINQLIDAWNEKSKNYHIKQYPNSPLPARVMAREDGNKFTKLVTADVGPGKSAIAFVNLETGDIFKSASWKAPAKGVRGSVMAEDYGISCFGPCGVNYLRGGNYGW